MGFKYFMNEKHEALGEFEAYYYLHWALPISTESLVPLLPVLLRVIMWENLSYCSGRILFMWPETRSCLLMWASEFSSAGSVYSSVKW